MKLKETLRNKLANDLVNKSEDTYLSLVDDLLLKNYIEQNIDVLFYNEKYPSVHKITKNGIRIALIHNGIFALRVENDSEGKYTLLFEKMGDTYHSLTSGYIYDINDMFNILTEEEFKLLLNGDNNN